MRLNDEAAFPGCPTQLSPSGGGGIAVREGEWLRDLDVTACVPLPGERSYRKWEWGVRDQ